MKPNKQKRKKKAQLTEQTNKQIRKNNTKQIIEIEEEENSVLIFEKTSNYHKPWRYKQRQGKIVMEYKLQ